MTARKKPTPGHKYQGILRGFTARCECGWTSATWYGKGGMGSASAEWHGHVARCEAA